MILADIDHFKKINDTYGHPVGDKILATVANVIRANVRKDVFVARTGGEEFAMIIEGNTEEEAMQICERIRRSAGSNPVQEFQDRRQLRPDHHVARRLHGRMRQTIPAISTARPTSRSIAPRIPAATARSLTRTECSKEFQKGWLIYKK